MPLMVSVDPERDTAEMLKVYMTAFDPRIIALRGTHEQTAKTAKTFAAYFKKVPLDGENYTMDHTAGVWLMKADGTFQERSTCTSPKRRSSRNLRCLQQLQSEGTRDDRAIFLTRSSAIAYLALTTVTRCRNGRSVSLLDKRRERQVLSGFRFVRSSSFARPTIRVQ